MRLGILVFNQPLINLPPARDPTPPASSTIGFYGFKSDRII